MFPQDDYSRFVYLTGSLFSRVQELKQLLDKFAEDGKYQGEMHLTHQLANGDVTRLAIHIDGVEFSMMPTEADSGFRFDVSGLNAHIE